ncbi:cupin domain-containing protein [Luteipulveratus halotolerans]|uniref:Cupin n=1 Tax=Luteipulveratus halotolerans TaxID=1631356 RepID=A0A0L6CKJ6_9MICO|nr:cupin domain-containing protein [Luteipulveratus halotolerans]KNX38145.1 cupin [Luteipulveratus halotolerans]
MLHTATTHAMHGARFHAYVSPSTGSTQLCAWRTELAPRTPGQPHTPSHEEVFLVLDGAPTFTVDDTVYDAHPGDVVRVPAGAEITAANTGDQPASMWVTTSVGIRAMTPDGTQITPPWAQ